MLTEGYWQVKILGGSYGADDKSYPTARVNIEFVDGPNKGQRASYNGRIDNKSAKYVARDLKAAGWKGGSMSTLHRDLDDAARNNVMTTAQVKLMESTKKPGEKFAVIGSLGYGPKPLTEVDPQTLKDCDDVLREFASHGNGAQPTDDRNDWGGGYGGPDADDKLPF